MTIVFSILAITSIIAFLYVNSLHGEDYMGTIVPAILSCVIGLIWTITSVVVLIIGNIKPGLTTLVVGLAMFARAYVEYRAYIDVQDLFTRWGRRG